MSEVLTERSVEEILLLTAVFMAYAISHYFIIQAYKTFQMGISQQGINLFKHHIFNLNVYLSWGYNDGLAWAAYK